MNARLRNFLMRVGLVENPNKKPNLLRRGRSPGPQRPRISPPILAAAEAIPEQPPITQDDRDAIKSALLTKQAPLFGRIEYLADPRSPWNRLENGASLEGYPASITTHTCLYDNNGVASPFTRTTVTLSDNGILDENNPLRHTWNTGREHLADTINVSFISKDPLHLDLVRKMKFTQTQNGIELNGVPLESYQSKLDFRPLQTPIPDSNLRVPTLNSILQNSENRVASEPKEKLKANMSKVNPPHTSALAEAVELGREPKSPPGPSQPYQGR